jgi:hypothetical protein
LKDPIVMRLMLTRATRSSGASGSLESGRDNLSGEVQD